MSEMRATEPLPTEVRTADPLEVVIAELFAKRPPKDVVQFAESVAHATGEFGDALRRAIVHAAVEQGELFGVQIMNIFENDAFQTSPLQGGESPMQNGHDDLADFHPQDYGA